MIFPRVKGNSSSHALDGAILTPDALFLIVNKFFNLRSIFPKIQIDTSKQIFRDVATYG